MNIFIIFLPRVVFINIKHNTMLTQNLQNDQKAMLHQRKKIGHIIHGPHPALWHSCQRFQSPRIPYCDSKQKLFTASELYWNCSLFVCLFFLSFIFLTFRFQPHEGSMFRYAEMSIHIINPFCVHLRQREKREYVCAKNFFGSVIGYDDAVQTNI